MKILVVDDELASRAKLQNMAESLGECLPAEDGKAALRAVQASLDRMLFDLITLDISMPEMDGMETLKRIRDLESTKDIPKEKRSKIVMVTSSSDKDTVMSCIKAGCNDFITKPFERALVLKKFQDLAKTHEEALVTAQQKGQFSPARKQLIEEVVDQFEERPSIELPPVPHIAARFQQMFAKGAELSEVAALLKQDMAITLRLVSAANSLSEQDPAVSRTSEEALKSIGIRTVKLNIDTITKKTHATMADQRSAKIVENLWKHSLACAHASEIICQNLKLALSDDIFTMALLHDIGKLLLLQLISDVGTAATSGKEIEQKELIDILDEYHTRFGASLLKKSGFAHVFSKIARYHDETQVADPMSPSLSIVHLSNLLAKSMGYGLAEEAKVDLGALESAHLLNLDSAMIIQVKDQVKARMDELEKSLT